MLIHINAEPTNLFYMNTFIVNKKMININKTVATNKEIPHPV